MAHADRLPTARTTVLEHLQSARDTDAVKPLAIVLLFTVVYVLNAYATPREHPRKPLLGVRVFGEPTYFVGLRFTKQGRDILREGYRKFSSDAFSVQCNDSRILVLPHRFVDELRSLPSDQLSSPHALYRKALGAYTGLGIILDSHLHFHALQQHLTPNLASAVGQVKDELDFALQVDLPSAAGDDWVALDVHSTLSRVVGRLSSRVFAGLELSRNDEWLAISTAYPQDAFECTMALRLVPGPLRPFAAAVLPAYWRTRHDIASAKRIISAIVNQRRQSQAPESHDDRPDDLLQWMMDAAKGADARPESLGHRMLFVSDASVMTTSLLISHCIFDLCANPQDMESIRHEIMTVLRQKGDFQKTLLHKMRKLDSALKESQRLSPPFLMTFDRIVRKPLTLSDGTRLAVGTHLAMPTDAMLSDPALLPAGGADPGTFDAFRYSRAREDPSKPENAQKFQLATTEATSLPFGHGKHACPGRFFASSEAKLILCHLLLMYDFRYPEGQGRPQNWLFSENLAPDPNARVLIRKRRTADEDMALLAIHQ